MKDQRTPQGEGFWKGHFASWKESGLTQKGYCNRAGISYQSFVYQHRRTQGGLPKAPLRFIEAKMKPGAPQNPGSSGFQVILPNGIRLVFDGEITVSLLQTLTSGMGSIPC